MTPDSPNTLDIVRLVLGIAQLGENDLCTWWQGRASAASEDPQP
jgi:hypothetical protein